MAYKTSYGRSVGGDVPKSIKTPPKPPIKPKPICKPKR
jgi:hypothetical protein